MGRGNRNTYNNVTFRSKFETAIAQQIEDMKCEVLYETDKIEYIVPEHISHYTPDFKLTTKSGKIIYIETKGRFDADDRKKQKILHTQLNNIDIRLVFQNAYVKITKNSRTTYADWCDKNNIKWANKYIPTDWFNE